MKRDIPNQEAWGFCFGGNWNFSKLIMEGDLTSQAPVTRTAHMHTCGQSTHAHKINLKKKLRYEGRKGCQGCWELKENRQTLVPHRDSGSWVKQSSYKDICAPNMGELTVHGGGGLEGVFSVCIGYAGEVVWGWFLEVPPEAGDNKPLSFLQGSRGTDGFQGPSGPRGPKVTRVCLSGDSLLLTEVAWAKDMSGGY